MLEIKSARVVYLEEILNNNKISYQNEKNLEAHKNRSKGQMVGNELN